MCNLKNVNGQKKNPLVRKNQLSTGDWEHATNRAEPLTKRRNYWSTSCSLLAQSTTPPFLFTRRTELPELSPERLSRRTTNLLFLRERKGWAFYLKDFSPFLSFIVLADFLFWLCTVEKFALIWLILRHFSVASLNYFNSFLILLYFF